MFKFLLKKKFFWKVIMKLMRLCGYKYDIQTDNFERDYDDEHLASAALEAQDMFHEQFIKSKEYEGVQ